MVISSYFPIWNKLTPAQQSKLTESAVCRKVAKGTVLHNGSGDCAGLFLVDSGQLRAYILSEEGREITIYRLFEMDICLFSASCMIESLQFDVVIEAEKDSQLWLIPSEIYKGLMEDSVAISNYTNQIMASRFSDVMWLIEQIMWKSFDKRLASFLLEEAILEGSPLLHITHEKIANHMGTAREVVTRMLRYFQGEGLVKLARGAVQITDEKGLHRIAE